MCLYLANIKTCGLNNGEVEKDLIEVHAFLLH